MSVINQMLRDLEQRREKQVNSAHYIDEVNIVARKKHSIVQPVTVIMVLLLTLVAGYFILNQSPVDVPINTESEVIIDLPLSISSEQVKPAQLRKSPQLTKSLQLTKNLQPTKSPQPKESLQSQKSSLLLPVIVKMEIIKQAESSIAIIEKSAQKTKELPKTRLKPKSESKSESKSSKSHSETLSSQLTKKSVKKSVKNKKVKNITVNNKAEKNKIEKINVATANDKAVEIMLRARNVMARDIDVAIKLLEQNLGKIKANADYFSLLANLYQRQQRYDNAILYYRKALQIAPEKGEFWIGIALAFRSNGESENERQAFQKAVLSTNIRAELRQYAIQQLKLK